ncbi:MAG: phage shock protein A, partial [Syntrophales bacterium LBB04]|nr:phage shock protein A [Syntrophales bacterium LBB04]
VHRHIHAQNKKKAQQGLRRYETSDAFQRFEQFENRIERMEAEAGLVDFGRKGPVDEELAEMAKDEELEKEIRALKNRGRREDV